MTRPAERFIVAGRRPDEFGEQRVIVVIARGNDQAVTHSEHQDIAGSDVLSGSVSMLGAT